jgi:WD40 repeat protein
VRHNGPVEDARWNADESRILTASDDGTVRLWDAHSGAALTILTGHTDIVFQAQWNADESRILTASADGTARQFYSHSADIITAACAGAIRNMTMDEWVAFMQGQPYRATCPNLPQAESST